MACEPVDNFTRFDIGRGSASRPHILNDALPFQMSMAFAGRIGRIVTTGAYPLEGPGGSLVSIMFFRHERRSEDEQRSRDADRHKRSRPPPDGTLAYQCGIGKPIRARTSWRNSGGNSFRGRVFRFRKIDLDAPLIAARVRFAQLFGDLKIRLEA